MKIMVVMILVVMMMINVTFCDSADDVGGNGD